jgi:hypothetical protein
MVICEDWDEEKILFEVKNGDGEHFYGEKGVNTSFQF